MNVTLTPSEMNVTPTPSEMIADTTPLEKDFGFKPSTPLRLGLRAFAEWYKEYKG